MAKMNSLLRSNRRRQPSTNSDTKTLTIEQAEDIMTLQVMTFFLSAQQVLQEDYNFTPEQLIQFQKLLQLRMEINRIKK